MQEKIAKCGRPIRDFDESFRTSMGFRTPKTTLPFNYLLTISGSETRMAHLDIETSNQIFDVLADWEHVLQALFQDAVNPYDEEGELVNSSESDPQP